MKQYLATEIESRQGVQLQLVLQFTHGLYQKPPNGSIEGRFQVFTNDRHFYSLLSNHSLNQDVVWDTKYLNIIQSAFTSSKERYASVQGNRLAIIIQLNKGVRLTVLSFELIQVEGVSPLEGIINSFVNASDYFQSQTSKQEAELKGMEEKNAKARSELVGIKETAKFEETTIKEGFIRIVNPLKLRMKRGANAEKEKEATKKEQPTVKAENELTVDEQILKFCF